MAAVATELRPLIAYGAVATGNRIEWQGMRTQRPGFRLAAGHRATVYGVAKGGGDTSVAITLPPDVNKVRDVESMDLAGASIATTFAISTVTNPSDTLTVSNLGGGTALCIFVYHDNPLRPPR